MSMTERVRKLRQQSLQARETLSSERAMLMTEFYRQNLGLLSVPVQRALAFQYLMEHKTIYIGEGELIVGEKGPAPKVRAHLSGVVLSQPAGPGYPEHP